MQAFAKLVFTAVVSLSFLSGSLSATPIVVVRTKDGYIVATNGVRSGGQRVCKLQYNDHEVTLHQAPVAVLFDNAGKPVFELNDVLWNLYDSAAHSGDYVSNRLVGNELSKVLRGHFQPNDPSQFQIALVHVVAKGSISAVAGIHPDVQNIPLANPAKWVWAKEGSLGQTFDLQVGEGLVWFLQKFPEKVKGEPTLAGVTRLLDSGIPNDLMEDFGPPYLIGKLDQTGFHFLLPDQGICTARHPTTR